MSDQQPTTPKPPRSSRRNQRRAVTTPTSSKTQQPKSSSPAHSSPSPCRPAPASRAREGASAYDSSASHRSDGANGRGKGKKKQGKHPQHLSPQSDNTTTGHRHSASQPSIQSSSPFEDSSRYAGPTFHASPAASALPMPTFFSKSVPDTDWSTDPGVSCLETEDESQDTEPGDFTPSQSRSVLKDAVGKDGHSSSPLDFLFKAARDAKCAGYDNSSDGSPDRASPIHRTQKRLNTPQSAPTDGAMFQFDMEPSESRSTSIGPSFATPYKERMDALRSASSPIQSPYSPPYEEKQINGKREIQRASPLNPHLQRPASVSPHRGNQSLNPHYRQTRPSLDHPANSFHSGKGHAMPGSAASYDQRTRTSARSASTAYGKNGVPHHYAGAACHHSQSVRTPSSNLRKEMSPPSPTLSPSRPQRDRHDDPTAAHRQMSTGIGNPVSSSTHSTPYLPSAPPGSQDILNKVQSTDTKQMEDYLRRALKLDANGE